MSLEWKERSDFITKSREHAPALIRGANADLQKQRDQNQVVNKIAAQTAREFPARKEDMDKLLQPLTALVNESETAREDDVLSELNHGSLADARVVAAGASGVASETATRPIYDYTETLPDSGKPVLEEAARVSVYTVDADKMVQRLSGSWDVIVVDFPDPNSVELAKLYSREFYLKLRRILSNGGVMAVQSTSPYHSKESFLCVRRTLDSAGYETVPYHDNVPSFGDWGWILAWHSPKAVRDVRNEIARLDHFGIPEDRLQYLTPEAFRSALTFGKGMLDSHSTEVNRLMHPVLLRFYLSESWQP